MIALALTVRARRGHGHDSRQARQRSGAPLIDAAGRAVLDYDLATPMMLVKLFPAGMLGLGLTALLASFMSGMAGNVTAFNTVWTYDIYQSHIKPGAIDEHYLWMGRVATVGGILLSIAAAYVAGSFNNIMDLLQLVFAFVNAPLFATFALGMFWKRTTGHGAFIGSARRARIGAAMHHGSDAAAGCGAGREGRLLRRAAHLSAASWRRRSGRRSSAWTTCFVVTIVVSSVTRPRPEQELVGLVYSMTPKPVETVQAWYEKPVVLAVIVLTVTLALNIIFF